MYLFVHVLYFACTLTWNIGKVYIIVSSPALRQLSTQVWKTEQHIVTVITLVVRPVRSALLCACIHDTNKALGCAERVIVRNVIIY